MTYTFITHSPGVTLADYRAVQEALGPDHIEGLLLSIAGDADGALHTVDVWESKACADRFTAERLFPAFQKTGVNPGPDSTFIGLEGPEIAVLDVAEVTR